MQYGGPTVTYIPGGISYAAAPTPTTTANVSGNNTGSTLAQQLNANPTAQAQGYVGVGGSFYNPAPAPAYVPPPPVYMPPPPAPVYVAPTIPLTGGVSTAAPLTGNINTNVSSPVNVATNVGVTTNTAAPIIAGGNTTNNTTNNSTNVAAPVIPPIPLSPAPGPVQQYNPFALLAFAGGDQKLPNIPQNLGGAPGQPSNQIPAYFPQNGQQQQPGQQPPQLQANAMQNQFPGGDLSSPQLFANAGFGGQPQIGLPQGGGYPPPAAPSAAPTGAGDVGQTGQGAPAPRPSNTTPDEDAAYNYDLQHGAGAYERDHGLPPVAEGTGNTPPQPAPPGQQQQMNPFQRFMKSVAYGLDPRQQYNDQYRQYLGAAANDRALARQQELDMEDRKEASAMALAKFNASANMQTELAKLAMSGRTLTAADWFKNLDSAIQNGGPGAAAMWTKAGIHQGFIAPDGHPEQSPLGITLSDVLNMPMSQEKQLALRSQVDDIEKKESDIVKDKLFGLDKAAAEASSAGSEAKKKLAESPYYQQNAANEAAQKGAESQSAQLTAYKNAQILPAEVMKPYLENQKSVQDLDLAKKAAILKTLQTNPAYLMQPQGQQLFQQTMEAVAGYQPGQLNKPTRQPNESPKDFAARTNAPLPPMPALQGGVAYAQQPSQNGLVPPPPPMAVPTGAMAQYPQGFNPYQQAGFQQPMQQQGMPQQPGLSPAQYNPAFGQPNQPQQMAQPQQAAPQQAPQPAGNPLDFLTKFQGAQPGPAPKPDPNSFVAQFGQAMQNAGATWQKSNAQIAGQIQNQMDRNHRIVETEIPGPVASYLKLMSPEKLGEKQGASLTDPQVKQYLLQQAGGDARKLMAMAHFAGWGDVDWQDKTPQLPKISGSRNPRQMPTAAAPSSVPPMPTLGLLDLPQGMPRIMQGMGNMPSFGLLSPNR